MLGWIWAGIIGVIVGALAKFIMPGRDPGGFWITMAIGIGGSLLATWLGRMFHLYSDGEAAGFIMSIIGAILLLTIYRFIKSKQG